MSGLTFALGTVVPDTLVGRVAKRIQVGTVEKDNHLAGTDQAGNILLL